MIHETYLTAAMVLGLIVLGAIVGAAIATAAIYAAERRRRRLLRQWPRAHRTVLFRA